MHRPWLALALVVTTLACGSEDTASGTTTGVGGTTSAGGAGTTGGGTPTGGGMGGMGTGGVGGTAGMGGMAEGGGMPFGEQRRYRRLNPVYDDPSQCQFNCDQTVEFCPSGTVHIVVTDITYPGDYVVQGDTITTNFPGGQGFEVSGEHLFTEQGDQTLVAPSLDPRPWNPDPNVDPFICMGP